MSEKRRIIVGIPAFNEEGTIARVVVRAQRHADSVVVVDDGSTDDTALIAEKLGAVVIKHERRLGYGAAIISCFRAARDSGSDILCTLDADGQHDPDQIPSLVKPLEEDLADVAIGSRFLPVSETQMPRYREAGVKLITRMTDLASGSDFSDAQSGFRAYNKRAFENIMPAEQGMGVSVEILMKAAEQNLRIAEVPVVTRYEGLRTSTHNPIYHSLDVIGSIIKSVSIRHPLMFYGGVAVAAFAVSIAFAVWALDIYSKEGRLVTNIILISMGSGFVGVSALFTAIILFVIINVIRERNEPT